MVHMRLAKLSLIHGDHIVQLFDNTGTPSEVLRNPDPDRSELFGWHKAGRPDI